MSAYLHWAEGWKRQALVDAGPAKARQYDEVRMLSGWSEVSPARETVRDFGNEPPRSLLACPAILALAREERRQILSAAEAGRPENRPEAGVNRLSLPVLSPDGREAIVEVVHTGQRHGGLQQFYLLRKTPRGWRVVSHRAGGIG